MADRFIVIIGRTVAGAAFMFAKLSVPPGKGHGRVAWPGRHPAAAGKA